jgi:hypothetical protein
VQEPEHVGRAAGEVRVIAISDYYGQVRLLWMSGVRLASRWLVVLMTLMMCACVRACRMIWS